MIELKNLTKYYGKVRGVTDINLHIKGGEIFGFIGPNGAGKSTTIRLLLSLIRPTSGKAMINGMDCRIDSKKIKKILGYVPSEVNYYDDMKVIDLFRYSTRFYNKNCDERAEMLSKRLTLDMNKKIDSLSFGNKKKVAIIQAILHEPKILILDEPTSGLDPLVQNTFFDILEEERKKGVTILFSSHILSEVQRLCDRIAIIKDGKIIKIEAIESLRKNKYRQVELDFINEASVSDISLAGVSNLTRTGKTVRFLYGGEIKLLLETLVSNEIENVSIEEPSLEEIFMHYYMEGSVK